MIYDDSIQGLETEKAELQAKYVEYGAEIVKTKTALSTSTDLKMIKTSAATREAAITARGNIERRIVAIEAEVKEWRHKQRAFRSELEAVPARLTNLRERLGDLKRRRYEQEDSLIRFGANLEKTRRQFSGLKLQKSSDPWLVQDREDPAAYVKSALKNQKEHQERAVNDLAAALELTERLITETEASIAKTETYLEGLRQAA